VLYATNCQFTSNHGLHCCALSAVRSNQICVQNFCSLWFPFALNRFQLNRFVLPCSLGSVDLKCWSISVFKTYVHCRFPFASNRWFQLNFFDLPCSLGSVDLKCWIKSVFRTSVHCRFPFALNLFQLTWLFFLVRGLGWFEVLNQICVQNFCSLSISFCIKSVST
jgi:hypothetical protein